MISYYETGNIEKIDLIKTMTRLKKIFDIE